MHYDVVIIGGGICGAALACSLAERGWGARVAIIDPDIAGTHSSSELNGGGVRAVFAEEVNVRIALRSAEYYRTHADAVDWRPRGYAWLYDEPLWQAAHEFLPMVRGHGVVVNELTPAALKQKHRYLGDLSDVAGATWTPGDGRLSPHKLRAHYLGIARAVGVTILDRRVVSAVDDGPPFRVQTRAVAAGTARAVMTDNAPVGDPADLTADTLVNAAGPWAAAVAAITGRTLPVLAYPRQVHILVADGLDLEPDPFFLDYPLDIYYRHYAHGDRSGVLVSWSDPAERPRIDYTPRGDAYYDAHVRPRLVRRIPALADARPVRNWVGHYELSADKTGIVGPVPNRAGLYDFNGMSAHGVMQSRGLGEALAHHITTGDWPTGLDLSPLSSARFAPGRLVAEKMYV